MSFERSITVLRDAAFKVGGELFAREATKIIAKAQAEEGNKEAGEALFNAKEIMDERHSEFTELIHAMAVLADRGKE